MSGKPPPNYHDISFNFKPQDKEWREIIEKKGTKKQVKVSEIVMCTIVLLVLFFCVKLSIAETAKENAERHAKKYASTNSMLYKQTSYLVSPDSLVSVTVTNGDWFGVSVHANYVIQRGDTTYVSKRESPPLVLVRPWYAIVKEGAKR